MNEIEEFKMKKINDVLSKMNYLIKESSLIMADAFYSLSYKTRELDSQRKANQRNNDKIKFDF